MGFGRQRHSNVRIGAAMQATNFASFWVLLTWCISRADAVGMLLSLAGFLIMMMFIEDMENN
jgi:hypothetical protein